MENYTIITGSDACLSVAVTGFKGRDLTEALIETVEAQYEDALKERSLSGLVVIEPIGGRNVKITVTDARTAQELGGYPRFPKFETEIAV